MTKLALALPLLFVVGVTPVDDTPGINVCIPRRLLEAVILRARSRAPTFKACPATPPGGDGTQVQFFTRTWPNQHSETLIVRHYPDGRSCLEHARAGAPSVAVPKECRGQKQ